MNETQCVQDACVDKNSAQTKQSVESTSQIIPGYRAGALIKGHWKQNRAPVACMFERLNSL